MRLFHADLPGVVCALNLMNSSLVPLTKPLAFTALALGAVAAAAAQSNQAFAFDESDGSAVPSVVPHVTQPEYNPVLLESDEEASAPPVAALDLSRVHDTLHYSENLGEVWVRGRSFKAAGTESGFTYIPFLGADAPQNYPVHFRLAGATVGGDELVLNESASVQVANDRYTLDRGLVDVRYDVALESVEQSFLIKRRGLTGEIVLDLDVTTELQGAPDGAGFRFSGPSGGVSYGAAIAFDEAGRTTEVPASLEGNHLRLTVPAAFVASARGMVTVDPIVTSFDVSNNNSVNYYRPDVTYDVSANQFVYFFEDAFSLSDIDLIGVVTDSFGAFESAGFAFLTPFNCSNPEAANLNAANKCMVVVARDTTTAGRKEIVGRMMDMTTSNYEPEVVISNATGTDNSRPDVGGNGSTNPNGVFLVAWIKDLANGDVEVRVRSVAADRTLGTQFTTGSVTGVLQTEVAVSKSTGLASDVNWWALVLREEDMVTGDVVLRSQRWNVTGNGLVSPIATLFTPASGVDIAEIDVSTALPLGTVNPTYLVTYDQQGTNVEDTFVLVVRDNMRMSRTPLQVMEHGRVDRSQRLARLSVTRGEFLVTYLESIAGGINYAVYLSALDIIEDNFIGISERRLQLGDTGALWAGGAAMASRYDSGLTSSRVNGIGWGRFETNGGSSSWNIVGVRHTASNRTQVGPQYGVSALNSTGDRGFIHCYGDNSTTATKALVATSLPPNQFGFFAVGSLPANVSPVLNSIGTILIGGQLGRFDGQVVNSGPDGIAEITIDPTALPTPSGFEAVMAGQFRQFQFWHRDVIGGTGTSNFTNAVSVRFR